MSILPIKPNDLERGRRIELLALAWKAKVLPLYEPRKTLSSPVSLEVTPRVVHPTLTNLSGLIGGWGWIRTSVRVSEQIYSLPPLATRTPIHFKRTFDYAML